MTGVKQREKMDCGIACAATWTGVSYERAREAFEAIGIVNFECGVYGPDIIKALSEMNHEVDQTTFRDLNADDSPLNRGGIWQVRIDGHSHWVVSCKGRVFDPARGYFDWPVYKARFRPNIEYWIH